MGKEKHYADYMKVIIKIMIGVITFIFVMVILVPAISWCLQIWRGDVGLSNSYGIDYSDILSYCIAILTLIVAILTLGIGVVAIFGYTHIKSATIEAATGVINKGEQVLKTNEEDFAVAVSKIIAQMYSGEPEAKTPQSSVVDDLEKKKASDNHVSGDVQEQHEKNGLGGLLSDNEVIKTSDEDVGE